MFLSPTIEQRVVWLNEVSSVPVQQSLRHLQTAFVNFWENGAAFPSFKRHDDRQSAEFSRSGFRWRNGQLTLARIGKLKIRWPRRFSGEPTTIHVSRTSAGRYYVSFRVDEPLAVMPEASGQIESIKKWVLRSVRASELTRHSGRKRRIGKGAGAGDTMKFRWPNQVRFASTNSRWFCGA